MRRAAFIASADTIRSSYYERHIVAPIDPARSTTTLGVVQRSKNTLDSTYNHIYTLSISSPDLNNDTNVE